MEKKAEYLNLLSMTYQEAVETLLEKYGPSKYDYFSEKSYERFLNGEIKNISKGKYSRTSEGLYCHHIDENKYENLSNEFYIKNGKYPFDLQRKDRLVYCDLFEHAILHILISKETGLEFGYAGYTVMLEPMIKEWYIGGKIPKPQWMKNCYEKAFISKEDAIELLDEMNRLLEEAENNIEQEIKKKALKEIEKLGIRKINLNSSRSEIIKGVYEINKLGANLYNDEFLYLNNLKLNSYKVVSFESFEKNMKNYLCDGIVNNIHAYIRYLDNELNKFEYFWEITKNTKTKQQIEDNRLAKIERKNKKMKEKKRKLEQEIREKKKEESFYKKYPNFKNTDVAYNLTRQEVNVKLFKYYDEFSCFIKFQGAMKEYSREELLDKLYEFMNE